MSVAMLTGFPGFIGTRLVKKLALSRSEIDKFYLLVQSKYRALAEKKVKEIEQEVPNSSGKFELVEGDITLPGLGIKGDERLKEEVNEFFHLAAVYDLAVSFELGFKVNVNGTENVINFLLGCKNLEKFHYVSTAYVSGWLTSVFSEDDFDQAQEFKNYYEETKFLAEKVVRFNRHLIPTAIYRPGIVVGDSKTGETAKFDGPYYVVLLMLKLPNGSPFPKVGSGEAEVNIVPVDYVVDSICYISSRDDISWKVYHLTDPRPHKVFELVKIFEERLGKKFNYFQISPQKLKKLMSPKIIQKIVGMPVQLIDYFDHQVHYESQKTQSVLAEGGISCPDFLDYVDVFLKFTIDNKKKIARHGLV
jgi:thioester reductase-like protein